MITTLLIVLAGVANGVMDLISFHWNKVPSWMKKREQFWNPELSWKNKWSKKYDKKERFIGSSTFLVFLTDGWHLCKEIMLSSISLAFAINANIVLLDYNLNMFFSYIVIRIIFYSGFKLTYR